MKKITQLDFEELNYKEAWDHIQALQTELDRLERVGREGFVPDWSKAPEGTVGCVAFFTGSVEAYWKPGATGGDNVTFIPRPAPKTRERTGEEKIEEFKRLKLFPNLWNSWDNFQDSTIDDLCRAAGIDLKVTEE